MNLIRRSQGLAYVLIPLLYAASVQAGLLSLLS